MLASINPLGERGRNQHYRVTVTAYVVGSTVAGALLGALLGLVGSPIESHAAGVRAWWPRSRSSGSRSTRAPSACACPGPRRQVNENWLVTYRGWVYGSGFGAQLGLAFLTIVTASATWVAFACALFAGNAAGGRAHRCGVRPRAAHCRS